ncbi:MCL1 protein, partial [Upupa epops]|nr:MCL1 protein [Upupa epops]
MFALKRNAVISFNLCCGGGSGGSSPALAATSPAVGGGSAPPPPPAAAVAATEVSRPLSPSAGPWAAAAVRPEPPRTLIGCGAAPRTLIGCGPVPSAALWSPDEELDGCEPDPDGGPEAERGPAGDSLPGTPPEPPGPPDALRRDSLEIIGRYLREAAGEAEPSIKKLFPGLLSGPGRPGGAEDAATEKALETLRRVGDGLMRKHELAFQGMLRKLDIQTEEDLQSVCEVAAHMFSDGVTNWGRVVTLISFGAFVAKHLKSINQEKSVDSLAAIITDALVSSKREWLLSQGGWEGFVDFFRVEDVEGSVRNVLMAFAGVAGLGAGLAYMIR